MSVTNSNTEVFARARRATMVALFLMGAPVGTMVPRLAEIKQGMGANAGSFGTAIALGGLGAMVGNYLGSRLVHWRGTKVVGTWVIALMLLSNIGNAIAPDARWLGVNAVLAGLSYSTAFVSINSQGVLVEQNQGRSFLPLMHAFWSLGTVVTGIGSSLGAPYCTPFEAMAATDIVVLVAWFINARGFLPTQFDDRPHDDPTQLPASAPLPRSVLCYLLVIAVAQGFSNQAEMSVGDWSSVLLKEDLHISVGPNGYAFSAFVVGQLAARLLAPRWIDRVGLDRVVRVLGYVGATGYLVFLGIAMAVRETSTTLALMCASLSAAFISVGVAAMPPAYASAAGGITGLPSARALMVVGVGSAVFTLGSRIGVALLAQATSLPIALSLMGVFLFIATAMSTHLHPDRAAAHAISR